MGKHLILSLKLRLYAGAIDKEQGIHIAALVDYRS
jgi:hypothetical protein